jgi:Uma2 family endonuclease
MATATRMTADEYYAITVEGDRKQLVDGRIVVNEPKAIHALLQSRLHFALMSWAEAAEGRGLVLFPTDIRIDEHNIFGPDVIWFADPELRLNAAGYPERLPELCVEVRSGSTWRYDIGPKKRAYEDAGLAELWLVDVSAETLLVYRRATPEAPAFDVALELSRGETLTSPRLPGFALPLDRLYER